MSAGTVGKVPPVPHPAAVFPAAYEDVQQVLYANLGRRANPSDDERACFLREDKEIVKKTKRSCKKRMSAGLELGEEVRDKGNIIPKDAVPAISDLRRAASGEYEILIGTFENTNKLRVFESNSTNTYYQLSEQIPTLAVLR